MSNMTKFIGGSAVFGQRVSNVETAVDALIGIPMPWAGATPPTNHLLLNGASFNKAAYPKLAAVYPSGVLPDLRGEFIRGWDNGRAVDGGRALLSAQAHLYERHVHDLALQSTNNTVSPYAIGGTRMLQHVYQTGSPGDAGLYTKDGKPFTDATATANHANDTIKFMGGAETRPRNVAFNYIVRAA